MGNTGTALVPLGHPRAAVDTTHTITDYTISDTTRARIEAGKAANTRRAYARQWRAFAAWCDEHGRTALPATPHTLAEYVSAMCDRPEPPAPATIHQAIAAIRSEHTRAGYTNQPDTAPALEILRAYKRARAEAGLRNQRESTPITLDALQAMLDRCDLATRRGIRDRLLLVLGLALMGRRSELVNLLIEDVRETDEGIEVTIRTSKTDKNSEGEIVAIPRGSHPLTDPVTALRDWLKMLHEDGITSGPLLRRVFKSGRIGNRLGADAVNEIVRRLAVEAGLPHAETYTAHSLRAGGATVSYKAKVPVAVIAKHGRWSPASPVVLRYIRAVDRWRDNAMRNVGL